MPMRSWTADRIRCLHPRLRSVACAETCPQRNLDLLQLACRSDLLEFPTGSLPVIRAFQTDKPQMRRLRRVSFHGCYFRAP